jgi:cell pole-organizing protein PopZ
MNKPAGTSTQNLEEILASIRKSLAEEAEGANSARKLPAAGTESRTGGAGLSSRLAGALNGSGNTLDGALADFLAHVPGRDAPPAARTASGTGEQRDPFWFLSRPAAAPEAPVRKDEKPGPGASDGVTLSRPETLRPSLPPLFVADSEPVTPVRRSVPGADAVDATDAADERASAAAAARAAPKAPPAKAQDSEPAAAGGAADIAAAAPEPAPPAATAPTEPALAPGEHAPTAGVARNPALEQMIAQLLEPVLVRWLDANLPRMIEGVVRTEVARALNGRS